MPNHSYIELYFYDKICLSKIKIYNYNNKNNLDICAKEIKIFFDNKYYGTIILRQGTGEEIFGFIENKNKTKNNIQNENEDFSQDITFPINNFNISKEFMPKQLTINKFRSYSNNQNYETPYLPSCFIVKFQFNNNYSLPKNNLILDEDLFYKYNIIGLKQIEIYDEKGINILNINNNYKIISNCEILNEDIKEISNNQILLNGIQNENGNNCLFYIFNNPIFISYIKLFPLQLKENVYCENSAKNIKIFCDNYIVFEGVMNKNKPSIVFFTSDKKLLNNLDEKLFIQCKNNNRVIKEEKNNKYISLILV